MTSKWLKTTPAASYADVHVETIRKAARLGLIACVRRGARGHFHFTRADIDRWLGKDATERQEAPND